MKPRLLINNIMFHDTSSVKFIMDKDSGSSPFQSVIVTGKAKKMIDKIYSVQGSSARVFLRFAHPEEINSDVNLYSIGKFDLTKYQKIGDEQTETGFTMNEGYIKEIVAFLFSGITKGRGIGFPEDFTKYCLN